MTVSELTKILSQIDGDAEVYIRRDEDNAERFLTDALYTYEHSKKESKLQLIFWGKNL